MNGGYESYIAGSLALAAIAVFICIYVLLPAGMLKFYLKQRSKNGLSEARRKTKPYATWFALIFIATPVGIYYFGGVNARSNDPECRESISDDGKLKGLICLQVFKLYSVESGELLAERTYSYNGVTELPKLIWDADPATGKKSAVIVNVDVEKVSLPPSLWERFKAKLP